jgi:hypothetical protein
MMSEDFKRFPNLIPIIWQLDGENASPSVEARRSLYGIISLPDSRWGGFLTVEGAAATNVYQNYSNAYDAIYGFSPANINFSFDYRPGSIDVSGSISLVDNLTTVNNKIVFILTTQLSGVQNENYFSVVIAYHDQNFIHTLSGDQQSFSVNFTELDHNLDMSKTRIIVMLQSFGEIKYIIQADSKRLTSVLPPFSLRSFAGANQISLMWEPPITDIPIEGFSISRDSVIIGTSLFYEPFFTDTNVTSGISYLYEVSTLYYGEASTSVAVEATTTPTGYSQFGSGTLVNSSHEPAPINITNRSLRGQFVYTAEELRLAGVSGPATISQLGFFIHSLPMFSLPNFRIRMKHTLVPDALFHDDGPFTTENIFTNYSPVSGDFDMLTLENPFLWDGELNILIDTAFTPLPTANSSGQMRIFRESSGFRFIWHVSADMTTATTTTVLPYKPQMLIYHGQSTSDGVRTVEKKTNVFISPNYPNPFNPDTSFKMVVHSPQSFINIDIFNIRGQLVKKLIEAPFMMGEHIIYWDGTDDRGVSVSSGVFFYKVSTSEESITQKMILIK